jgi:hypothetical protein
MKGLHLLAGDCIQILEGRQASGSMNSYRMVHDLPAGVVRELVEGLAPLGGHLLDLAEALLGNLPALGPLARLAEPALDSLALGLADRLELLLDVVEGGAQIVAVQLALAALAHPLHQIPQAGQPPLRSLHAPLEQPAERALEVALGHQFLGHGVQQILGVEVPDLLRPVSAVAVACSWADHATHPQRQRGTTRQAE